MNTSERYLLSKKFRNDLVENNAFWRCVGIGAVLLLWYLLSDVILVEHSVLLDPVECFQRIYQLSFIDSPSTFWLGISNTLLWTLASFSFSFVFAFICSATAHFIPYFRYIFEPFIVIFRTSPVVAIMLFLFLLFPWYIIPFIIAVLMTFPLLFQDLLASFDSVVKNEIDAATALGLNVSMKLKNVYIPNAINSILANIRNGFGITLKVIIAAQVLEIPSLSLGYLISSAKQSFNYHDSFCYLVVVLIISCLIDYLLSKVQFLVIKAVDE